MGYGNVLDCILTLLNDLSLASALDALWSLTRSRYFAHSTF